MRSKSILTWSNRTGDQRLLTIQSRLIHCTVELVEAGD